VTDVVATLLRPTILATVERREFDVALGGAQGPRGINGTPGGNQDACGPFTGCNGMTVASGVTALRTSCWDAPDAPDANVGGAWYVVSPEVDSAFVSAHPRAAFITADARGWLLAEPVPTILQFGALGDDEADDTAAIQAAEDWCAARGLGLIYPKTAAAYRLAGAGLYDPGAGSIFRRGVIAMRAISRYSNGATLRIANGQHNAPGIFCQAYWQDVRLDGCTFMGEWVLDGNVYDATKNPTGNTFDTGYGDTEGSLYQQQHGIYLRCGSGFSYGQITGTRLRGDVLLMGEPGDPSTLATRLVTRVRGGAIHGIDVFREVVLVACADDFDFGPVSAEGDGCWVTALDIERHVMGDQINGGRIRGVYMDAMTGYAPREGLRTAPTGEPTLIHMRRIMSCNSGYLQRYPGDAWDGKFGGIHVDYVRGRQCVMDSNCFAHATFDVVDLECVTDEDTSGWKYVPPSPIGDFAHDYDGGGTEQQVTGVAGLRIGFLRVHGPYRGPVWFSSLADLDINMSIVGVKGGIRFDNCSGAVRGTVTDIGDPAGAPIAAISIYGTQGPLDLGPLRVRDTRTGGARRTLAGIQVYGAAFGPYIHDLQCWNITGTDPVLGANYAYVRDAAIMDGFPFALTTNVAVSLTAPLDVDADVTMGGKEGDTVITVRGGPGSNQTILFTDTSGIQYKIGNGSDGSFLFQNFNGNAFQRSDIIITDSGKIRFNGTYATPIEFADGLCQWGDVNSLYVKKGQGASPTDGVVVATTP
jgi:hypothetical protein